MIRATSTSQSKTRQTHCSNGSPGNTVDHLVSESAATSQIHRPGDVLSCSVLVLNRSYMPVHVISARRAIVLLFRDLVEVIQVDEGRYYNYDFTAWLELSEFLVSDEMSELENRDFVRSINFQIEVPRIVRLFQYDKVPQQSLRFNRRNLFARDNNQCQFCAKQFPISQLSFDHVLPRSRGGKTTWENVVCSCLKCNSRKGNRTPNEAGMKLVRKPVKPKQNPMLALKLDNPRYESWRTFLKTKSSAATT